MNQVSENDDSEWEKLFLFQKKIRKEKNITGPALLRLLNLPLTVLSYLYTSQRPPSKKENTYGGKLRVALKLLLEGPLRSEFIDAENTIEELLSDYRNENKDSFTENGVLSVNFNDSGGLCFNCSKAVTKEVILDLFRDCSVAKIKDLLPDLEIEVYRLL